MSHSGDHIRASLPAALLADVILRLRRERDEALSCLRIARPLLADCTKLHCPKLGREPRLALVARIDKALEETR